MDEELAQSLQGQVSAINLVISSILPTLSPLASAQAAVHLAMALENAKDMDLEDETPAAQEQARTRLAEAYLGLLDAQSKLL